MVRFFKVICLSFILSQGAFAQDNPYGTEGLNHIGLAVSKLDESVNFFVDVLG